MSIIDKNEKKEMEKRRKVDCYLKEEGEEWKSDGTG